ncbi:MAG TPA: hypothetical protein VGB91_00950 [Rhizomicrobium sp.]
MILSERHGFIFVKGMKVAGTSVEIALSRLCGPDDIVTPISPIDELARLALGARCRNYAADKAQEAPYLARLRAAPPDALDALPLPPPGYTNHMPLAAVALRYGKDISRFRVVCVERSPYAKVISWANMQLSYGAYKVGGAMRADIAALKNAVDVGFQTGTIRDPRNIDRYRGPDGKVVAQPMRYVSLAQDFAAFVAGLGVAEIPSLPHTKKGLLSESLEPREVFRPDQIKRINLLFREEFETFGYEMIAP